MSSLLFIRTLLRFTVSVRLKYGAIFKEKQLSANHNGGPVQKYTRGAMRLRSHGSTLVSFRGAPSAGCKKSKAVHQRRVDLNLGVHITQGGQGFWPGFAPVAQAAYGRGHGLAIKSCW